MMQSRLPKRVSTTDVGEPMLTSGTVLAKLFTTRSSHMWKPWNMELDMRC